MRKILTLLLVMLLTLSLLCSCDIIKNLMDSITNPDDGYNDNLEDPDDENKPDDEGKPDDGNKPDGEDKPDDGNQGGNNGNASGFIYNEFTDDEADYFLDLLGEVIPYAPNNEHYLEEYTYEYEDCYEVGINFYTVGNSKADFDAYRSLFSDYTFDGSEQDEYGDIWYYYTSDLEFCIDMAYYTDGEAYYIDVYAYLLYDYDDGGNSGGGNDGDDEGGNDGGNEDSGDFLYNNFTEAEKSLFTKYFGEVIPFFINNEYYVEEYDLSYDGGGYEEGINFYVYGATEAQFTLYRTLFSDYTYEGTNKDEYGDSWYYYTADSGYYVDMCYYETEDGRYVADIYVYSLLDAPPYPDDDGGGGDEGGSSETDTPDGVITNEGAGLPSGTNGIYNIDFTKAEYVKNVGDQGNYLGGCPTVGSPKVLVIPIHFSDYTAASAGCTIDNIIRAFMGSDTDYYSVDEYYYISSYGRLDLDITVVDQWFMPNYSSSYYADLTDSEGYSIGSEVIMDEALRYLAGIMDLSDFDSDGNSIIDAVVMINTLEVKEESDFNWAYRYWNYYVDDQGYYYEYDGVSANDFIWASYFFMHESYEGDEYIYSDRSVMNTYTYIHEFGHILGADDYYDTSERAEDPMGGLDVMDAMYGDHNPYTKFNFGWLTTSRLVTATDSITLTLDSFTKTGDSIIIANNWDEGLGAYQEYYVVIYYTMDGLNGGDFGYFEREGVVVYHINASLCSREYDGEVYYDVYNNNTHESNEYGTKDNLVEFVTTGEGNYTYTQGDRLPSVTDDQGNGLSYSFTVDSITDGKATLTFTKN